MNNPHFLIFQAALILLPLKAIAKPIYLTFTGTVTFSNSSALDVGQSVSHVWMYDLDRDGFGTRNGVVEVRQDVGDYDFFYTEFVGGQIIPTDVTGLSPYWFNYGYNYGINATVINGSNSDPSGHDQVWTAGQENGGILNWEIGQTFRFNNWSRGSGNKDAAYLVQLSAITDYNPLVPEPQSIALMVVGLVSLLIVARKCSKA